MVKASAEVCGQNSLSLEPVAPIRESARVALPSSLSLDLAPFGFPRWTGTEPAAVSPKDTTDSGMILVLVEESRL